MKYRYRYVSIYADSSDNLIIIPTGVQEKWGGAVDIDLAVQLNSPYSDEELEKVVFTAFDKCFSITPDEQIKETAIEKFLNVKGYSKAVKDRRFISFFWNDDEGYIITPTQKVPRQGYCHLNDKAFRLGMTPKSNEIAKAIREAVLISSS